VYRCKGRGSDVLVLLTGVRRHALRGDCYGALPRTAKYLHVINNPYQPTLALQLPCVGEVKIYTHPALAVFSSAINQTPRLDAALQKESRFCSRLAFRDIPLELEFCCSTPRGSFPRYRPVNDPFTPLPEPPVFRSRLDQHRVCDWGWVCCETQSLPPSPLSLIAYQAPLARRSSGPRRKRLRVTLGHGVSKYGFEAQGELCKVTRMTAIACDMAQCERQREGCITLGR
jgi:hypothetical protein